MSTASQHNGTDRVSKSTEIPPRVVRWLQEPRVQAAYAVYRLGNGLERLSGKIHPDLEGAGDHDAEGAEWYAMGQRYTARQTLRMLNLAFKAGQESPQSMRPIGDAFDLGYGMGRRDQREANQA